ncbi:MAG: hypothetical protein RLZZ200_2468 [Pseudomonadota bacterium]|jgi:hypothetical protein
MGASEPGGVTADDLKYHEEIHRYAAVTAGGKDVEILERVTYERVMAADGSLSGPREVNRRFDLKTGERLDPLGGGEFRFVVGGERVSAQRPA